MKYNKFFITAAIATTIAITSVFMANHLQAKTAKQDGDKVFFSKESKSQQEKICYSELSNSDKEQKTK